MAYSDHLSPHSFLDVPAKYHVKVDDVVQPDDDRGVAPSTGAGAVLVAKICDALAQQGYEDATVKKVGDLVVRNLMSLSSTQVKEEPELEARNSTGERKGDSREIESILGGLLDKNRPGSVVINSNEPVLLLNGSNEIPSIQLSRLAQETIRQLQMNWNIWPVRIYAGRYIPAPGSAFSIALLNVVNTDIGGPSMVQLLDDHTEASDWHSFVRREVWRDRNFVAGEDGNPHSMEVISDTSDQGSERSHQSDDVNSVSEQPEVPQMSLIAAETSKSASEAHDRDVSALPRVEDKCTAANAALGIEHDNAASVHHDQEKHGPMFEEVALLERDIAHPSWDRWHDSSSLIDLIRSQALNVAPPDFGENTQTEDLNERDCESGSTKSERNDDESFVVL